MLNLKLKEEKPEYGIVSLTKDGDDIDINISFGEEEIRIAWIDGADGKIHRSLHPVKETNTLKEIGLSVNSNGVIKIEGVDD